MKNGMHVNKMIRLRPNRSMSGPTINEPTGKKIVTKLAATMKWFNLTFLTIVN